MAMNDELCEPIDFSRYLRCRRDRALNDHFRRTHGSEDVMLSPKVAKLDDARVLSILDLVRRADTFTGANYLNAAHDSGSVCHEGERFLWRIYCYDSDALRQYDDLLEFDGSDPAKIVRVLSIIRPEEL
jgi:Protein of unknown function (DUF3768)